MTEKEKVRIPAALQVGTLAKLALAAYCTIYSRWKQAELAIQKHGLVFVAATGYRQQNPEVSIAASYLKLLHDYISEFGLGPASRSRIKVPTDSSKEESLEDFADRKRG